LEDQTVLAIKAQTDIRVGEPMDGGEFVCGGEPTFEKMEGGQRKTGSPKCGKNYKREWKVLQRKRSLRSWGVGLPRNTMTRL